MSGFFWPVILLVASIFLLFLETLVPSAGVLGILAALALVAAIWSAFMNVGLQGGTGFLVSCVALAPVVFWAIVQIWPKTPIGKRILGAPINRDEIIPQQQKERQALLGRTGITISAMLPSGAVRINGRAMDAVSVGMTIEKDMPIEVVAVQGNHLVVRPADPEKLESDSDHRWSTEENRANDILNQPMDAIVPDPFDDRLS